MLNFDFCSPTHFAFGKDTELRAGELCKKFGAKKVLIVTGQGKAVTGGLLSRIEVSLANAGIESVQLSGIKPNPTAESVYAGIDLCRKEGVDFVLAAGGGSAIDAGKAIAMGACFEGDFWDIYERKAKAAGALKIACVLTIAAAGSEGSSHTVITNNAAGKKIGVSYDFLRPVFAILNPALTLTLPPYQTACGAADIFCHAWERYFSPTEDGGFTDRLCESVMVSALDFGKKLTVDPVNYGHRANIMWTGVIAHNNVIGVGREQDWSSHGLGHRLSYLYDTAHGASLTVMMPAWLEYTAKADYGRVFSFGQNVLGIPALQGESGGDYTLRVVAELKSRFKELGLPVCFDDIGAKAEDIPVLVDGTGLKDGDTVGAFMPLTKEDIRNIYLIAAGA